MVFSKRKRILIIILIFAFLLLAIGGIFLLTRSSSSKKSSEKEKKLSLIGEEKIEFLVKFEEEIRSTWNLFIQENSAEPRPTFFINKNHPVFQSLELKPGSQYYLKILKSQKEIIFFSENHWVKLRKK